MNARPLLLLGLIAALIPPGCDGPNTEQRFARHLGAIRGGQPSSDIPAVVGIVIELNGGAAICSGSLIAPNLVLTAQHCVAEIASERVECGRTPFGALYAPGAFHVTTDAQMRFDGNGQFVGVREVQVPVRFADTCGHDIAVLVLDRNLDVSPLTPRLDAYPQAGETFSAYGYGHIGDETGSGTRRVIHNRQFLCTGPGCEGNEGITGTELVGDEGTCQGDSGGPPIDAQGRVLGALSRGGELCSYPTYSATAAWADWLREMGGHAAGLGGYRPPEWTGLAPIDFDLDGFADDQDNCPEIANATQSDLDEDGRGDACDLRIDRDCSVCAPCEDDAACGPGAYCSGSGQCFMRCGVDADCPDADTTVCATYSDRRVCVNRDHLGAGLCAAGFVCGVSLVPVPEPEPDPDPGPELPEPVVMDPGAPAEPAVQVIGGRVELRGGCSSAPSEGAPPWWALLGLGFVWRHRRPR
jgi:MYXO-CTERM domain-containing protein